MWAPFIYSYEDDDVKIARLNASIKEGNCSVTAMHYLIAERDAFGQWLIHQLS